MVLSWFLLAPMVVLPAGGAPKQACPTSDEIAYIDAPLCVGQTRRVLGRIDHVGRTKSGTTFVNFCSDWTKCPFTAVILRERAPLFADLARLSGSEVVVTGRIVEYRGRAEILLERPEQVLVRAPPDRRPIAVPVPRPPVAPPTPVEESPAPPPKTDEVVKLWAAEAGAHEGKRAIVRGRMGRVSFDGADLVVRFRRGAEEVPFVAVILEPDVLKLKDTVEQLDGQAVSVEGEIAQFNGRPAIFVNDPAQLRSSEPSSAAR